MTRGTRLVLIVLAVVVALGVVAALALPPLIEKIVESKLASMPGGYQGTIDHVELHGLGTEVALCGFTITKKNGAIPVPFLKAKEFDLIIERDGWKPRTVLRYVHPEFNFVDAESEAKKQLGPQHMIEGLRDQLPFELTRVEVADGVVHFRNYQTKPDMDISLTGLNVRWERLLGCLPPGNSACRSKLSGEAKVMKSGNLELKGRFARTPENELHMTAHLRGLRAVELNPFLQQYVKIKAEQGRVALDLRYDRHGERHDALLIPLLDDIDVAKADGEDASFLRKLGAGIATGWFERKKGDKGIAITKKPNGTTDFEIVDKPDVHDPRDAKADD